MAKKKKEVKKCYLEECENLAKEDSYFCGSSCQDKYWPPKKEFKIVRKPEQQPLI